MPYVGQKPADIISTAVDTVTGTFSGEVDAASLDISGNIDVDGTTNLDVTDIDGTLNVAGETTLQTHLNMGDDDTIKLGAGVDLTLASNGTHGTIATPNGILTVDAASTLILDSDAGNIQLKDGGNNFMTLSQTSSTVASINIPTSDGDLHIVGNDGGVAVTAMSFDMSAGGAATIANGLTLTDGNLVVASGHGIDFSATGDGAGTDTSELLSDYEEGTFTPTLAYSTAGNASFGYAAQVGHYVKVGDIVHFQLNIRLNAFTKGTGSGAVLVAGLPYTSHNTSGYASAHVTISFYSWTFSNIPIASVTDNAAYATINTMSSNAAHANLSDPGTASMVWLGGTYRAT